MEIVVQSYGKKGKCDQIRKLGLTPFISIPQEWRKSSEKDFIESDDEDKEIDEEEEIDAGIGRPSRDSAASRPSLAGIETKEEKA